MASFVFFFPFYHYSLDTMIHLQPYCSFHFNIFYVTIHCNPLFVLYYYSSQNLNSSVISLTFHTASLLLTCYTYFTGPYNAFHFITVLFHSYFRHYQPTVLVFKIKANFELIRTKHHGVFKISTSLSRILHLPHFTHLLVFFFV